MKRTPSPDFRELLEQADPYHPNPDRLGAVSVFGLLRKSLADPSRCVLIVAGHGGAEVHLEFDASAVVHHAFPPGEGDRADQGVTVEVRPEATVTVSLHGRAAQAIPIAAVWRALLTPPLAIDWLLNTGLTLAWNECRDRAKRDCDARYPDPASPQWRQCMTERLLRCGPRPWPRTSDQTLAVLAGLIGPAPR